MAEIRILSSTAHPELSAEISTELGVELSPVTISRFSCGEIYVNIEETVRGKDVYIMHTSTSNVNEDYMELFLLIDAVKRSVANSVHVHHASFWLC